MILSAASVHALMQVAEQTPLTAARYGELALEAGIPPGVLNVIQGGGAPLSQHALCRYLFSTLVARWGASRRSPRQDETSSSSMLC
jgi:acyl-CoA reductase-like NAD-dependent aldehyde dehydrogenase